MLEVNEYFDGQVKSIGFKTDTLPATVGVMSIGEYEFSTSQHEVMTVVSGELEVLLPEQSDWKVFSANSSFEVPANSSFKLIVKVETAYLCTYN